jgi:putative heme-binding domain-containing protein
MEDAQAMSNHLTWGPDGWLYGVNGSTTTCRIRGLEFQQGLWRYHPVTREFELFSEGGSNCYGVTFDANGEAYYSTNGGPFVNAVQGGYFYKSFGKHGPLHNLHAYHYFPEVERDQVPGGPPTGGTIYLADAFPKQFRGSFIAGNFLGHTVSWWMIQPTGTTVRATYGGVLADAHDTWFGPTDVCLDPDGALYVSDFYDQRTAHPDPDANWDRSNGRIYKIAAADAKPRTSIDIAHLSSNELVNLLSNANHWYSNRARVELAHRRDSRIVDRLCKMATQTADNRLALEGLWALNATIEIADDLALQLLKHPYPYVRYWTIRLVGDRKTASPSVIEEFTKLAGGDGSFVVHAQLAATARRLAGPACLQIVEALLRAHPNESDTRIPWLIWWAVEAKAMTDTTQIVGDFSQPAMWSNPAAREIALLLIRRYAAEGTPAGYDACAKLIRSAPEQYSHSTHELLRKGLAERAIGLQGIGQGGLYGEQAAGAAGDPTTEVRSYEPLTRSLKAFIAALSQEHPDDPVLLELALRAGIDDAYPTLKAAAFHSDQKPERLASLFALLREFGQPDLVPSLVQQLNEKQPDLVKLAALDVLATHETTAVTSALIAAYPTASQDVKHRIRDILFSRPGSALIFLQRVDDGKLGHDDIPIDQLRRLSLHNNEQINALVHKHWGNIGPGSSEEKLATMRRFNNDLRAGTGNPAAGKLLFEKNCAVCHQLFGHGNHVGPDLTIANRADRAALLGNIVDPSAVIRREFMNYVVTTSSGRVLTGVVAEQDAASVTIVDANNQRTRISRNEIDDLHESDVSLMPERLLEKLAPQELRDLFAYVQSPKPL